MDNKTFINTLAERCERQPDEMQRLTEALASILRDRCSNMATVALPAFGNFTAVKTDEHIGSDPDSGKTMLYPPAITLTFTPGAMLKKHIRNER
ncbi:MAG: HU family DNA-binding protein [Muribaculaceae bacterium]|nr:HU family DNA-binding protein [Muribaculaceae bacterium]